jgi:hypothetical protein
MTYWENELNKVELSGGQVKLQLKTSEAKTNWINLSSDQFAALQDLLLSIEEEEEQEHRVIFRKFPWSGEIIALLPDQYNPSTGNIGYYMHNGQHAETAPDFGDTKPAEPGEYYQLEQELRQRGYNKLRIVKRFGKLGR